MYSADVAVVGAGLGGLAAAVALARAGKKVIVLEHHSVPGGYAHEFRRGRYRFDVSLHAMDGVAPGGQCYDSLRHLGVLDRLTFKRLDPFYVARYPGREITASADVDAYQQELIRQFPEERDGICSAIAEMKQVCREAREVQMEQEHRQVSLAEFCVRYPHLRRALQESLQEYWDRHLRSAELKAVMSTLWQYFGLPPSQLNAAPFIISWGNYHIIGGYYPIGGSAAVSRALEAVLKEHGGEVLYRQTVSRVHVSNGRVTGVSTRSGVQVSARAVVSNANVPSTVMELIEPEHLPPRYLVRARRKPPSVSSFCIYLGLENVPEHVDRLPHETWVSEDYDLEGQYEAVLQGDWDRIPYMLTYYRETDPSSAPPGGAVMVLATMAPWDYEHVWGTRGDLSNYQQNPQYISLKQRVADRLLDRLERFLPGVRRSIRICEISTPLTNLRYTLNRNGAIYGFEQSVRGYLDRFSQQTPITGLFLAGAWGSGGGQSSALYSGRVAARLALLYLNGTAMVQPP